MNVKSGVGGGSVRSQGTREWKLLTNVVKMRINLLCRLLWREIWREGKLEELVFVPACR